MEQVDHRVGQRKWKAKVYDADRYYNDEVCLSGGRRLGKSLLPIRPCAMSELKRISRSIDAFDLLHDFVMSAPLPDTRRKVTHWLFAQTTAADFDGDRPRLSLKSMRGDQRVPRFTNTYHASIENGWVTFRVTQKVPPRQDFDCEKIYCQGPSPLPGILIKHLQYILKVDYWWRIRASEG